MFLAIFVTFLSIIPRESYSGDEYQEYYTQNIQGSDFLLYNQSTSWNATINNATELTLEDQDIEFRYEKTLLGRVYVQVNHITTEVLGVHIFYHRLAVEGLPYTGDPNQKYYSNDLLKFYDNQSDAVQVLFWCDHIQVNVRIVSASENFTTAQALSQGETVNFSIDYQVSLTNMGTNILTVMLNLVSGQTVRTGQGNLDILFNALITIPIDIILAYVVYKLIAGLIPTVSGGSGT